MTPRVVGEGDQGQVIRLRSAERIEVRLRENPTTGFRWSPELPADGGLALVSSKFVPPAEASPGAGGERVFELEARRTGRSPVKLLLSRPGQTGSERELELTFEVVD